MQILIRTSIIYDFSSHIHGALNPFSRVRSDKDKDLVKVLVFRKQLSVLSSLSLGFSLQILNDELSTNKCLLQVAIVTSLRPSCRTSWWSSFTFPAKKDFLYRN